MTIAIRFGRAERRALAKLANGNGKCPQAALPDDVAETFIHRRLLYSHDGAYHLTVRGQIEAIRQHFRLGGASGEPSIIVEALRTVPESWRARLGDFRRQAS